MKSGSVAGAEMTTFFAPASRCFCAPSRLVKKPVDSRTTSTPRSPHGNAAGSRSESIFICSPPALMTPSPSDDLAGERAQHRVVLQEVRHRGGVAEVVDRDDLHVRAERLLRPEEVPPDAPETVDANANRHDPSLSSKGVCASSLAPRPPAILGTYPIATGS